MINRRLINEVENSKKYILLNVLFQWMGLVSNIIMIFFITDFLGEIYSSKSIMRLPITILVVLIVIVIRYFCVMKSGRMSYLSSKEVKSTLREKIYEKLLRLGPSYQEKLATSEIVQVSVEGVEQLETYFGMYLPQFIYSIVAPLTLFIAISTINLFAASILLVCVPLIPIAIICVQTFAKKLLSKYWDKYTTLGDNFLENLQGLTILKIYQADEFKNEQMNHDSEVFRKITMKVLSMQLNSIIVMDFIALGGAALGIIVAVTQLNLGNISLSGCLFIILLSADFFIPMRILGSYFHIAMNGMAASEKIFKLLDIEEVDTGRNEEFHPSSVDITDLRFSYNTDREILKGISMWINNTGFTAIVGESGCGKSTIASILTGRNYGYRGQIKVGNNELSSISEENLLKNITYIGFDAYLFKGTVRENLLYAKENASDSELWTVLNKVNLDKFLVSENGLDTELTEKATNLSGGQRQRLALARAILHDTPIYIFDEATSNIDVESENEILERVYELSEEKAVIFITHRLANVRNAENIYVLKDGKIVEYGDHDQLIGNESEYKKLWDSQYELENFGKEKNNEEKK